jgi:mannose-6-phosphate isomerase-like protein (cupin superfamily)
MVHFQHPRRKFIQTGIGGFCLALFANVPKISFAKTVSVARKGIIVREEDGVHLLTGRRKVPITIKISRAKDGIEGISFCVETQTPGKRMRIHKHLNNDELIFIHKGEGTLTLDDEAVVVKAGDVAFVPRGVWHGLDNTGKDDLSMVFQYSPAGFEEYFIENGTMVGEPSKEKSDAEYTITERKYGMVYRDPR